MKLRVALFTHRFLEPTHYAIGQTLDAMSDVEILVFARWFGGLSEGIGGRHVSTRRLLAEARFDASALAGVDVVQVIYDGDTTFDAVSMAADARRPVVLSFHGGFDTNAKIFDNRYRARTVDACRRASVITVVGNTDVGRLGRLGVTDNVIVLPVPIDTGLLPPKLEQNPWQITVVGRLVPKKGIDLALRCLALLPPPFSLTVVGDGELGTSLMDLARTLGVSQRVRWVGAKPLRQTLKLLAESAVLLHPARVCDDGNAEGTPQALLWAQALGVPVVATDTGSITDIVKNGRSGLLVDPDPASLSAAVSRLSDDHGLRSFIVSGGLKNVRRHQVESVSARLLQAYRSATVGRPPITATPLVESEMTCRALEAAAVHLTVDVRSFRLAGRGGHGRIFVVHNCDGQLIAVKIPAYDAHGEERWPLLQHKLRREWSVLSEAAGDGLPLGVGVAPDGRFLARHYVVGEALSRAVRYASPSLRTQMAASALVLGQTLFRRFHHHVLGSFVIRDFKPQNIVVPIEAPQHFQLVDVGAVLSSAEVGSREWTQERLGTGQWLHWAPEQLLGDGQSIGVAVDFFALGVTAFYCLTGQYPYSNGATCVSEVINVYREEYAAATARLETAVSGGVDSRIARAIAGCIEPDVGRRLKSQTDLDGAVSGLSTALSATELFGVQQVSAQGGPG